MHCCKIVNGPNHLRKVTGKKNKGKGKSSQKTCYTCGIVGHISPECRNRKGKGDKETNQQDKKEKGKVKSFRVWKIIFGDKV